MTSKRDYVEMSQSHDMNYEPHHGQVPPPSIPTNIDHIRHNPINCLNDNHIFYANRGIRSDMDNIQGEKTNTRGKNENLEIY